MEAQEQIKPVVYARVTPKAKKILQRLALKEDISESKMVNRILLDMGRRASNKRKIS